MSSPAKAKKKRPRQRRRAFRNGVGQVYSERQAKWVWAFDIRISGARIQESGFPTRDRAEAAVTRLKNRALDEKYDLPSNEAAAFVSLAELVEARLADPQRKAMPSHRSAERILRSFRDYFPPAQAVTSITTADVRAWIAAERSGVGPGTVNNELGHVSSLLHSAGSYFPALEGWAPPRLPYTRKPEERDRPLSLQEAKGVIEFLRSSQHARHAAARLAAADIFQLALLTGMRQSEWRLRKWAHIDFEAGTVRLTKTKTGRPRVLRMTPSVRAILVGRLRARGASDYVFPSVVKRERPVSVNAIRRWLVLAAEALVIPYGRGVDGGFTFHDTRHTAITEMLAGGNDLATVADISGHSKKSMTLRYGHATTESRERALHTLEKFSFDGGVEEKRQTSAEAET